MKLLDRYIAVNIAKGIGLVTLFLTGLFLFILFVTELHDLGKAQYGIVQVIHYVFLRLPYNVYLFFPMASLLGCLVALGALAKSHELIVMRVAGVSILQIAFSVLKAALFLTIMVSFLGETITPRLVRIANDNKMEALSNGKALRTKQSLWIKQQNDFISIGTVLSNTHLHQVYQFRFDEAHQLQLTRHIENIIFRDGAWQAYEVHEAVLSSDHIDTHHYPTSTWDVFLKPALYGISNNEPDEMTLIELNHYVTTQKIANKNSLLFQLEFWQRVFRPLTILVMVMLAIPFIFGPLRSSTMEVKVLAAAAAGFGFDTLNRLVNPLGQLLQLSPITIAIGPTVIFSLIGVYLMCSKR